MNESQENPSSADSQHEPAMFSNAFVVIIGLIMLTGLVTLAWIGSPRAVNMAGNALPKRFDLQPLINTENSIQPGDLDDKVVVLHFWGTWCGPCVIEFPEFVKLYERFKDETDVQIVSVSCSSGPDLDLQLLREQTQGFLAKFGPPIPTHADATGITRQQFALLSNSASFSYPTTVVVGRDGTILESVTGYAEGEMERLADLVAEQLR